MRFLVTTIVLSIHGGTKKSTYISLHDPHSGLSTPLSSDDEVDWFDHGSQNPKSMLVQDVETMSRLREHPRGRLLQIAAFPEYMEGLSQKEWEEAVLREAEMLYAKPRADADTQRINVNIKAEGCSPSQTNILLI
ncbi:hypothetical protein CSAL01_08677 [Colletotrichum salicis]|uniref:Uncharacterized protein n=1 Tax=Colletotrichum salicis TaxID=1209931 RepID=A0A135SFM3_9PEZI|nr:hypothetical protein CSAL01_08677 [Colletotrichum salicis]